MLFLKGNRKSTATCLINRTSESFQRSTRVHTPVIKVLSVAESRIITDGVWQYTTFTPGKLQETIWGGRWAIGRIFKGPHFRAATCYKKMRLLGDLCSWNYSPQGLLVNWPLQKGERNFSQIQSSVKRMAAAPERKRAPKRKRGKLSDSNHQFFWGSSFQLLGFFRGCTEALGVGTAECCGNKSTSGPQACRFTHDVTNRAGSPGFFIS